MQNFIANFGMASPKIPSADRWSASRPAGSARNIIRSEQGELNRSPLNQSPDPSRGPNAPIFRAASSRGWRGAPPKANNWWLNSPCPASNSRKPAHTITRR
ncbi:unnamed protein product [Prorocentrum cordatum]|uniref:Uncharacterized protein n=1 Tax=Prorocentrum cordatum TaxID=2364126 RepID=A0ABN9W180_9DINO|nr:unnamed protein product [Polarella glacialis]